MADIILFNMMTLDGFFEGPDHSIEWHRVDEEFNDFAIDQLHSAGGLIFGRVTYELMASYWPSAQAIHDDPEVAQLMNTIPKMVFSRTLQQVDWTNTRLVQQDAGEEIRRLKETSSKNWFIFGSAKLASVLIEAGLVDEYRVMVNPVILGSGEALFQGIRQPVELRLQDARTFANGNVLLRYRR